MYKEMKLMDLAKLVNGMDVGNVIDFVNGNSEDAAWYGGWCGIKRIDPFDNDNPQYLIGHYGGEANTRFYAISEYDPRIGDFCAKRLEYWDYVNERYTERKEEDWTVCVARMIADFILDYDGCVSEVITVDNMDAEEIIETCPHCDHDNYLTATENQYIAKCDNCGKDIFLCSKCMTAEDNPNCECDWFLKGSNGETFALCKRGIIKE